MRRARWRGRPRLQAGGGAPADGTVSAACPAKARLALAAPPAQLLTRHRAGRAPAAAQDAPKSTWLRHMQLNTPVPQDHALRRDLDGLLAPSSDASDRAAKFAKFAARAGRGGRARLRAALTPAARARRTRLTTASAAWLLWLSRRTR